MYTLAVKKYTARSRVEYFVGKSSLYSIFTIKKVVLRIAKLYDRIFWKTGDFSSENVFIYPSHMPMPQQAQADLIH